MVDGDAAKRLTGRVTSASVSDAMARRHGYRTHAVGLVPARPGTVTAGFAATVRFGPRRDDIPRHDLAAAAQRAFADVPEGAVLIIAAPDAPAEAVAGGKKLAAIQELGASGVIAWGAIRDRDEAAGLGMGVWALGETPRASGDLLQIIDVGVPVTFGGVTIVPGDWGVRGRRGARRGARGGARRGARGCRTHRAGRCGRGGRHPTPRSRLTGRDPRRASRDPCALSG